MAKETYPMAKETLGNFLHIHTHTHTHTVANVAFGVEEAAVEHGPYVTSPFLHWLPPLVYHAWHPCTGRGGRGGGMRERRESAERGMRERENGVRTHARTHARRRGGKTGFGELKRSKQPRRTRAYNSHRMVRRGAHGSRRRARVVCSTLQLARLGLELDRSPAGSLYPMQVSP